MLVEFCFVELVLTSTKDTSIGSIHWYPATAADLNIVQWKRNTLKSKIAFKKSPSKAVLKNTTHKKSEPQQLYSHFYVMHGKSFENLSAAWSPYKSITREKVCKVPAEIS